MSPAFFLKVLQASGKKGERKGTAERMREERGRGKKGVSCLGDVTIYLLFFLFCFVFVAITPG